MKKVKFISADYIAEVLANPTKYVEYQGSNSKSNFLQTISSMLWQAEYEQDVISDNARGGFVFYSMEASNPDNPFEGYVVFKEKNLKFSDTPKVDIIIPTIFSDINLLNRALESALSQTYTNFRIILVGDGVMADDSTPFSDKVKQGFEQGLILHVATNHRGVYPSKGMERWHIAGRDPINFGVALSDAQIINRLDDDDVLLPDHLSTIVDTYLKTDGNGVIYTQPCFEDGTKIFEMPESFKLLNQTNVTFTCTVAYCGDTIKDLYYEHITNMPGDYYLYQQLQKKGHSFTKVQKVTSLHRQESHVRGNLEK